MPSLFDNIPEPGAPEETFETLRRHPGVRIERIVSHGHASPGRNGEYYDQPHEEFVLLVRGSATIEFPESGESIDLNPGDWLPIAAHQKHRVSRTALNEPTIWLAVHFGETGAKSA